MAPSHASGWSKLFRLLRLEFGSEIMDCSSSTQVTCSIGRRFQNSILRHRIARLVPLFHPAAKKGHFSESRIRKDFRSARRAPFDSSDGYYWPLDHGHFAKSLGQLCNGNVGRTGEV